MSGKENQVEGANVLKLRTSSGKEILSLTPKPDNKKAPIFGTPLKPLASTKEPISDPEEEKNDDDLDFQDFDYKKLEEPLRSEFTKMATTVTNLELDVEEYRKEYERIQVEGKQLYEAYESKCARLKDVMGRQDSLQAEIKSKEEQIEEGKTNLAAAEQERDQWKAKYEEFKTSFRDNFAAFKQLKEENERLKAETQKPIQTSQADNSAREAELLARISSLEAALETANTNQIENSRRVAEVDRSSVQQFERLVALFSENQQLYTKAHKKLLEKDRQLKRAHISPVRANIISPAVSPSPGEPVDVTALRQALHEEQLEVEALRAEYEKMEAFVDEERSRQVAALQTKIDTLTAELKAKNSIVSSMQAQRDSDLGKAKAEAEEQQAELERQIKQLTDQVLSLNLELSQREGTQQELGLLRQEKERLAAEAEEANARSSSLKLQVKQLQAAADEADSAAETARQQAQTAEERCAGLANLIEAQTIELQSKEKEFQEALESHKRQAKTGSLDPQLLERMEQDLESRLEAQAELEAMLQASLEDLEASKNAYVELLVELDSARANAASLSAESSGLSDRQAQMEDELKKKNAQCSLLQDNYNNICSLLKTVEADNAGRKKQLATTIAEQRNINRSITQLAASLGVVPSKEDTVATVVPKLEQAVQHLKDSLRQLESGKPSSDTNWTVEEQEAAVEQVAQLGQQLQDVKLELLLAVKEKKEMQLMTDILLTTLETESPSMFSVDTLLSEKLSLQSQLTTLQARLEATLVKTQ